ncbi:MarR family transcriptional regulator [Campylobacter sp. JMF_01 NE2]|uniref:MarR family winged helix-turn-helix transcriptional regulator n=1 Tax=unclassified Campylobacter TaxID=2593542 RepID=UPI0022E9DE69|nr:MULTISPECIES: MarR family transcriptional regulator [unclassified Campylobacter]MDA3045683.1 MarR family transcriptional regulator [Campylobacter sp. VBCF_06 NA8]MDA3052333.1 MarR family transcriptional regulator [Campylobacter sp. JMF_03 NE3]MDA3061175.1 MarR family transcriptional regulator [Campylobacter sp. VBCF_02 NA5]MDA3062697.1 MarR family transcriptional regulator [Campylobacter sp. JMF_14 EL1]MDA3066667.1 MarR family transcriptional regulator [Campylobacter sp. JMF_01 NE2]
MKKERKSIFLSAQLVREANDYIINEFKRLEILGISPSHGDIFHYLFGGKILSPAQIATKINRTKATVTTLLDRLEMDGYLVREKDKNDARSVNVKLTPKGESLKPKFDEISKNLNKILAKNFSEFELDALDTLLSRAIKNFNKKIN